MYVGGGCCVRELTVWVENVNWPWQEKCSLFLSVQYVSVGYLQRFGCTEFSKTLSHHSGLLKRVHGSIQRMISEMVLWIWSQWDDIKLQVWCAFGCRHCLRVYIWFFKKQFQNQLISSVEFNSWLNDIQFIGLCFL